ncbi:hypothetical protein E7892_23465, partial [Salmonella enterica]|nr:hypothetical protein [Salmonella enterica]
MKRLTMKEFFTKYDALTEKTQKQNIHVMFDDNFNVYLIGNKKNKNLLAVAKNISHATAIKVHFDRWLTAAKSDNRNKAVGVHVAKTTLKEILDKRITNHKINGNYHTVLNGNLRTSRKESMKVTSNIKEAPTTSAGSIALD